MTQRWIAVGSFFVFWGENAVKIATLLWVEKKMDGIEWGFEGVEVRGAEVGCFFGLPCNTMEMSSCAWVLGDGLG